MASIPKLRVFKVPNMNIIVLKQDEGGHFFVSTKDSLLIDIFGLSSILKFLLFSRMVSPKVLEGILEEFYSSKPGEGYVRENSDRL
jgi:hypothetical protein